MPRKTPFERLLCVAGVAGAKELRELEDRIVWFTVKGGEETQVQIRTATFHLLDNGDELLLTVQSPDGSISQSRSLICYGKNAGRTRRGWYQAVRADGQSERIRYLKGVRIVPASK